MERQPEHADHTRSAWRIPLGLLLVGLASANVSHGQVGPPDGELVPGARASEAETVERIRKLGAAIFDWITDVASVHPSLRTVDVDDFERMSGRRLEELLVPDYIDSVDLRDGWGRLLEVYLGEDRARRLEPHIVLIRSRGANGIFSGPVYAAGAIAPGAVHEDLVWAEGFWIRWPSWLSEVTALPDDRFVVAER